MRGERPLVGIDARKVRDFGIGTYIRNLVEAMAQRPESNDFRFRLYLRSGDRELFAGLPDGFETVAELTRFAWRLWRDRLDLFHATHYVLPPLLRGKAVVTIHDIIHLLYPQFLPSRAAHIYARAMIRRALRRADRIITVSYNSKRDLVDYFSVPPSRIEVIYNGVSPRFHPRIEARERERIAEKYSLPRPYLLFLGGEKPHKNVQGVVRAFAEAIRRTPLSHALALAGPLPKNSARLEALIAALDLNERVCRPGVVEEEDLPGMFAGADIFLYPTLYEGFGLPVVEAMACGTPVLTSATSALQEVAGGYAYLVDPMDVDAISRGIVALTTDGQLRSDLVELGKKRALDFSWDKAAERTLEVYRTALTPSRRA